MTDARWLIAASGVSHLGGWLYNVALLAYVYNSTGSAGWVGAATVCRLLPAVPLAPLGGVVADRHSSRSVLLWGDLLRGSLMLTLTLVVSADGPVLMVVALTALMSAAGTAEQPATTAMLPVLVGESRLGAANALLRTVQDVGTVAGPALGAVLLYVGPAEGPFLATALAVAVSAMLVSTTGLRASATSSGPDVSLAPLRGGFRVARSTPFVMPLLLVVAMAELTYGAQIVQLVLYADRRLDIGPEGYGYLLCAAAVGGLLSARLHHRLAAQTRVAGTVVAAAGIYCATQLVYAGTDTLGLALAVALLGGAAIVTCEVVTHTALARVVPSAVIARVLGVQHVFSITAVVAGALLAPVLIAATSLRVSLAVLGLGSLLVSLLCRGALRGLDELSQRRTEVLARNVAVLERLPIASGLSRAVLEQLAGAGQMCPLPPGVDVVVEGAPAHAFYAMVEGSAVVHRDDQEVARLGPGDHFGERGLLDRASRNATVTTAEQSTVLRLEGEVLLQALQAAPALLFVLDGSGLAPGQEQPTALVDDPTWAGA